MESKEYEKHDWCEHTEQTQDARHDAGAVGRAVGRVTDDVFEVGKGGKSAQKVKIKVDFSFHLKIGKN